MLLLLLLIFVESVEGSIVVEDGTKSSLFGEVVLIIMNIYKNIKHKAIKQFDD